MNLTVKRSEPIILEGGLRFQREAGTSAIFTEVDLSRVDLITVLRPGELFIWGDEKLQRLRRFQYACLDAGVWQALRENPHLIPDSWKEMRDGSIQYICFDGTTLRGPDGREFVPTVYWNGNKGRDGAWEFCTYWLGRGCYSSTLSAVLAS